MLSDHQTNFLYLADTLPKKFGQFSHLLEAVLQEHSIAYAYIPGTKDIWARDYMPVQQSKDQYIQFVYNPDYLQKDPWPQTITDVDTVVQSLGINTQKSTLVVDGGNIVSCGSKALLTEKVFTENKHLSRTQIEKDLKDLLFLDEIIILPRQPYDYIGHADGMVRFMDEQTVLINDYTKESKTFQKAFHKALDKASQNRLIIPYNPYGNTTSLQANGTYINYLQMQGMILVPTFDLPEDKLALEALKALFPQLPVVGIPCNEIADEGGVLNCICWTNVQ